MKKTIAILVASLTLSGCMTMQYTLDGKIYTDPEAFRTALTQHEKDCLSAIEPLPAPIVDRDLVAVIPAQDAIFRNRAKNLGTLHPEASEAKRLEAVRSNALIASVEQMYRSGVERIRKRGIYRNVQLTTYETEPNIQPTEERDIYLIRLSRGHGGKDADLLITSRNGEQAIAMDASLSGCPARSMAMFDALVSAALR